MFDWVTAKEMVYAYTANQFRGLFHGPEKDDVYGAGFFCDASVGDVLAVANTEQYHAACLREFEAKFGLTDHDEFRWDIGNWKYPAGLHGFAPNPGEFDAAWRPYRESLQILADDDIQRMLEDMCSQLLAKLISDAIFASASGLKGFAVLGPDDPKDIVLAKKKRLDSLLAGAT